jgi:3-dehydroquinate dehydratase II
MKVLLINGPNLNLLGTREPEVYGDTTLQDIETSVQEYLQSNDFQCDCFHSNHEGKIIDYLHENRDADSIIINPGGLTHTSISLRDALASIDIPFIEVHISNIHARESFRHFSYLSAISSGSIVGCGVYGYRMAADLINHQLSNRPK